MLVTKGTTRKKCKQKSCNTQRLTTSSNNNHAHTHTQRQTHSRKHTKLCLRSVNPRVTSSVGCCHGDEWHGGAWRQHCVLHMLPLCCHTAATPTTPEERVHCITSSEDKKHFVVLEKCRCISSPLADSFRSASTGLRTKRPMSQQVLQAQTWV